MKHDKTSQLIQDEIERLPEGYHQSLSNDFLRLAAILRLSGFDIIRVDEAKEYISKDTTDLWVEMQSPYACLYDKSTRDIAGELQKMSRQAMVQGIKARSSEYLKLSDQVVRQNMEVQRRLLELLEEFYSRHAPSSFYARLIVESDSAGGESNLKPQGASIRIIMDEDTQRAWHEEFRAEMLPLAISWRKSLNHKTYACIPQNVL